MIDRDRIQESVRLAKQLSELEVLKLSDALLKGDLNLTSNTLNVKNKLQIHESIAAELARVMHQWHKAAYEPQVFIACLQTAIATLAEEKDNKPELKLVWTGPTDLPGVAARTNLSVLLELIDHAQSEIVVVGYSITDFADVVFKHLALSRSRGVRIVIIANQIEQFIDLIRRHWLPQVPMPVMYTRPASLTNATSALHAKVIIVDQAKMLVTSANLTYNGLEANVEIGVVIKDVIAAQASNLFNELIKRNHIIAYHGNPDK